MRATAAMSTQACASEAVAASVGSRIGVGPARRGTHCRVVTVAASGKAARTAGMTEAAKKALEHAFSAAAAAAAAAAASSL